MMEVNKDDVIVNIDHNIPANTTDIVNSKGPEHQGDVVPSSLPMKLNIDVC
jgi:hypothetical protein